MLIRFAVCCLLFVCCAGAAPDTVWPGFRGTGNSVSSAGDLPLEWSARGRKNFAWQVRLPGYGQSSPAIWQDKVFVTAVDGLEKDRLIVCCLDLASGRMLWQREFAGSQKGEDKDTVARGAPTPTVDEQCVYALFETGDILALDHGGSERWKRSLVREYGEFQGPHGYASSPLAYGESIIVQVAHRGPSYLLALEKATGRNVWKVELPAQSSWSTPALLSQGDREQLLVNSSGTLQAFDPRDGKLLWHVQGLEGNAAPTPTVAGELVVVGSSELGSCLAVRTGGTGDVTQSHIAWRAKATSSYCSPLVYQNHVYFVNKTGAASCFDLETGEHRWTERLAGTCWASPLGALGRVYFFTKEGTTAVVRAGPKFELLAENELSTTDIVYGVAAVRGSILIRHGRSLVRVGQPDARDVRRANSTR